MKLTQQIDILLCDGKYLYSRTSLYQQNSL